MPKTPRPHHAKRHRKLDDAVAGRRKRASEVGEGGDARQLREEFASGQRCEVPSESARRDGHGGIP